MPTGKERDRSALLLAESGALFVALDIGEVGSLALFLLQEPLDTDTAHNRVAGVENIDADIAGNAADIDFGGTEFFGNFLKTFRSFFGFGDIFDRGDLSISEAVFGSGDLVERPQSVFDRNHVVKDAVRDVERIADTFKVGHRTAVDGFSFGLFVGLGVTDILFDMGTVAFFGIGLFVIVIVPRNDIGDGAPGGDRRPDIAVAGTGQKRHETAAGTADEIDTVVVDIVVLLHIFHGIEDVGNCRIAAHGELVPDGISSAEIGSDHVNIMRNQSLGISAVALLVF